MKGCFHGVSPQASKFHYLQLILLAIVMKKSAEQHFMTRDLNDFVLVASSCAKGCHPRLPGIPHLPVKYVSPFKTLW